MMMRQPGRVFWPMASLMLLADCTTKRAIEEAAPAIGVPVPIIDGFVRFTLAYNTGAAFSTHFGTYQRWVLIATAVAVLVLLARSYTLVTRMGAVGTVGLALVFGGAMGNLRDRLVSERGVVDFIDVGTNSWRFFVFNVADAGIGVGAILLAFALWQSDQASRTDPARRPRLS